MRTRRNIEAKILNHLDKMEMFVNHIFFFLLFDPSSLLRPFHWRTKDHCLHRMDLKLLQDLALWSTQLESKLCLEILLFAFHEEVFHLSSILTLILSDPVRFQWHGMCWFWMLEQQDFLALFDYFYFRNWDEYLFLFMKLRSLYL